MTSWDSTAWPYKADMPQRYGMNRHRYLARGGQVNPERDVQGFVAGGLNQGDMARFYFFSLLLDQVMKEGLKGDLAELGVYKGNTAVLLAGIARRIGGTVYLFDTFEGFSSKDLQGIDADKRMEFADTSIEGVRALVGEENVRFVQGYFPASLEQIGANKLKFCVAHIDCDLYSPMMSALEYFYPRMVPGGFLILHDYSSLHWDGAERAIDAFFADKMESVVMMPDGSGSAVVRRARTPNTTTNWLLEAKRRIVAQGWIGPTAHPGIQELTETGWSGVEDWGVWGLGGVQVLKLVLPTGHLHRVSVEVDGQVVLGGERTSADVDVWARETRLTTWEFDLGENRAIRRVRIPDRFLTEPVLTLEFRTNTVKPRDVDPGSQDQRDLGFGLHRVQLLVNVVDEAEVAMERIRRAIQALHWIGPEGEPGIERLIGRGWGDVEPWGVWGIGPSHTLTIPLPDIGSDAAVFEFEVEAVLIGARKTQTVDVLCEGETLDSWVFEQIDRHSVRTLRIPSRFLTGQDLPIQFRPAFIETPAQLDRANPDNRELGLGLHRFRLADADINSGRVDRRP